MTTPELPQDAAKPDATSAAPATPVQTMPPQSMRAIKLAVTLGIILIGVLVGGVGVVMWKIAGGTVKPAQHSGAAFVHSMELPRDAKVVSTSLDGDRIAITIELEGEHSILLFSLATGRLLGRVEISPQRREPPAIIGG